MSEDAVDGVDEKSEEDGVDEKSGEEGVDENNE